MNVAGDPTLPPAEERRFRKHLIARALQALATSVEGPTVLDDAPLAREAEPVAVRRAVSPPTTDRATP